MGVKSSLRSKKPTPMPMAIAFKVWLNIDFEIARNDYGVGEAAPGTARSRPKKECSFALGGTQVANV
jgi:hypothetical protein